MNVRVYIHQTPSSVSGDRGWGRMGGGPVSITWFLSRCALTLLSFFEMLTEPVIVWCERVFATVSTHLQRFSLYVLYLLKDKAGDTSHEKTKTTNALIRLSILD